MEKAVNLGYKAPDKLSLPPPLVPPAFTISKSSSLLQHERGKLPIVEHRQQIIDTINIAQVTLIAGETGSGKSTQVCIFVVPTIDVYVVSTYSKHSRFHNLYWRKRPF